jgi:hypothetical protein
MTAPTARELCDLLRGECDHSRRSCESIGCCGALAARVEKVLALKSVYAPELLDRIHRILNGESE